MPIAPSTMLWGHVLTSLVSNAISVVVIMLVALLMGFRSSAGILSWLAVVGILALFTLALTWVAVIPGLTAKSTDGAAAFCVSAHLPALYQLGVCAHQVDAAGRQGLCRKPASDGDRGYHPCVTGWTASVSGYLGCACMVRRHSGGGLHLCDEGI